MTLRAANRRSRDSESSQWSLTRSAAETGTTARWSTSARDAHAQHRYALTHKA